MLDYKFKQNSILELEKELRTRGENNLPSNWENNLTLDYWKNWREKIKSFHYMDEVHLYESIFKEIKTWIANVCANPHKYNSNTIKKVEEELSRIPIITNNVGDDWWTFLPKDPQELIMIRNKRSVLHGFICCESWNIPNWENYLTLDYWKNYQKKIMDFKNIKELYLYGNRLSALRNFIENKVKDCSYANWNQERNISNITIAEEEARLAEIESEEDWKKDVANAFPNTILKELSTEEMMNDPWFNKEIDNLFGLENGKLPKEEEKSVEKNDDSNIDYKSWTKDQLITEINRLKTENEELKTNKSLTNSEKQERLKQNQQKIDKINSYYDIGSQSISQPNSSNDKFPTGWVIGGAILLSIGGLLTVLIYKNKKSKK